MDKRIEIRIELKRIIAGQQQCTCKKPKLKPETTQCGNCGNFIDRVKHVDLINGA